MADPYGYISSNNQNQSVSPSVSPIAGNAIGIIAVNLDYPKLPGNVANATTFTFPVDYEVIDLEIEQLFENDPAAIDVIINAAKRLEARGLKQSLARAATLPTSSVRFRQVCGFQLFSPVLRNCH